MSAEPKQCEPSCGIRDEHVHVFGAVYFGSLGQAQRAWIASAAASSGELREVAFGKVLAHIREKDSTP